MSVIDRRKPVDSSSSKFQETSNQIVSSSISSPLDSPMDLSYPESSSTQREMWTKCYFSDIDPICTQLFLRAVESESQISQSTNSQEGQEGSDTKGEMSIPDRTNRKRRVQIPAYQNSRAAKEYRRCCIRAKIYRLEIRYHHLKSRVQRLMQETASLMRELSTSEPQMDFHDPSRVNRNCTK